MKLAKTNLNLQKINSLMKTKGDSVNKNSFLTRFKYGEGYSVEDSEELKNYALVNIVGNRVLNKRSKMGIIGTTIPSEHKKDNQQLIKEIISSLRKAKIPTVSVETEKAEFYRDFGFENSVFKKQYQISNQQLKTIIKPNNGKVKTGKWSDLIIQNGAVQLYEVPLHSTDERYTMNRPYWYWKLMEKLHPERQLAVFFGRIGLPTAYAFYEVNEDKKTIEISEFFSNSKEGVRGILAFLADIGSKSTIYHFTMSAESHLEDYFENAKKLSTELKPQLMTRIIDFPMVLSCMKMLKPGSIKVEVKDPLCDWNDGCWKANFENGKMQVLVSHDEPNLSGDIVSWTEVLLGEITLENAIKLGKIKAKKSLDNSFVKGKVSFFEDYK